MSGLIQGLFAPESNVESRTRVAAAAAQAALSRNPPLRSQQSNILGTLGSLLGIGTASSINRPPYASRSDSTTAFFFRILFFLSLTAFVLFIALLLLHFTVYPIFVFSPNDPGFIPVPTASDRELTYIKSPAYYDLSANIATLLPCSYTIGMDVFLSGNFLASEIPRVILYRAESPVTTDSGTVDTIADTYEGSNIVVWLDPVKNDLYVSALTSDNDGNTITLETTAAIENVPVRKVFRVAVVFAPQFIEVYINGRLEKSLALRNPIVTVSDTTNLYPTIRPIQQNVMIGNLSMWPRILTAREISTNESGPIKTETFFFKS